MSYFKVYLCDPKELPQREEFFSLFTSMFNHIIRLSYIFTVKYSDTFKVEKYSSSQFPQSHFSLPEVTGIINIIYILPNLFLCICKYVVFMFFWRRISTPCTFNIYYSAAYLTVFPHLSPRFAQLFLVLLHPGYHLKIHSRELIQMTKVVEFTALSELCLKGRR